jgi:hypothetical protein
MQHVGQLTLFRRLGVGLASGGSTRIVSERLAMAAEIDKAEEAEVRSGLKISCRREQLCGCEGAWRGGRPDARPRLLSD